MYENSLRFLIPLKENDRFGGISRLYGQAGLLALNKAHVCVVGVGGVGSWTVEALARSGVGALTLVDLDEVCVTNVNRQLQALDGSFGKFKVEELKNRISNIFPSCNVYVRTEFFNSKTSKKILKDGFDFVVDAIDNAPFNFNPAEKPVFFSNSLYKSVVYFLILVIAADGPN